jgi:dephospho-CoA kinase
MSGVSAEVNHGSDNLPALTTLHSSTPLHFFTSSLYFPRLPTMLIIGLTGSIATGKSTVSSILSTSYSLPIIDADLLARKVVEPGTAGYKAIVNYFGPSTPDLLLDDAQDTPSPQGKPLNRPALGRRVFGDTDERKRDRQVLNGIIHPAVRWEVYKALIYHYLRGQWAVVLDVPLLFESGMDLICGTVLVVGVTDPAIQMARLRARDAHLTAEDAENRVRSQGDVRTKAAQAEFRGTAAARGVVVWNDADKAELERAIKGAMVSISASSPRWWAWALLAAPPVGFGIAAWNLIVNYATQKDWEKKKREEKARL